MTASGGPYLRAADPLPLESGEFNKLHGFYDRLATGRLATTRCTGCGRVDWPPRGFCPACTSDAYEWVDLPSEGRVHGFTVQETGIPAGYPRPLVFGMVEVTGLRILAPLLGLPADEVRIGMAVRVRPLPVAKDPQGQARWLLAFAPVSSAGMTERADPASRGSGARPGSAAAGEVAPGGRPLRVLVAKPGLDGHDRGAKVVVHALRDAGLEVIYSGLKRGPDEIVAEAVQEDVDVIGLSVLSGAHLTLAQKLLERLQAAGAADIGVVVGGTIPAKDAEALRALGIRAVFPMGTALPEIVAYFRGFARGGEEV